jgi:glycerophosphoryl diester phosphodiesterase
MRSYRSAADPLDPGPAGFAHRGLHRGSDFPENSLVAFAAALEAGAGIECDLRLTDDDRVVVFHDADAKRMCGSPLRIGECTLAELGRLRLGDGPIPSLESLLHLVAGRVPLLLEVKVDGDIWRWAPALKRALGRYAGPFGIMSFDSRLPRLIKTNLPHVRRGLVIKDSLSPWMRGWAVWLADPQFIAIETTALGKPWVERMRQRVPVYTWTVRSAGQRQQASVHADAALWENDGRP